VSAGADEAAAPAAAGTGEAAARAGRAATRVDASAARAQRAATGPRTEAPDPRYARRDAAVGIFRELGWEDLAWDKIAEAPLGDKTQRAALLAGLTSGDWRPFGERQDGTFGWHSPVQADRERLALLALRVGVPAPRAAALIREHVDPRRDQLVAQLAAERGEAFSAQLVARLSSARNRFSEMAPTRHAAASVTLAERLGLDVEANIEWLRDWACVAAAVLQGQQRDKHSSLGRPQQELLRPGFEQHAGAAATAGVSIEGPLAGALHLALTQGWLSHSRALELAVAGLDAARKQNQRRGWLGFIETKLRATDAELAAHAEALLPALSSGDGPLAGALVPRIAPLVAPELLPDLALAASAVKARGQRAAILSAFAALPAPPPELAAAVLETLGADRANADAKLARAAVRLWEAWGGEGRTRETLDVGQQAGAQPHRGAGNRGGPAVASEPGGSGAWLPTPELWEVPRFEVGEASLPELGRLAGLLVARRFDHADEHTERFLALANTLAAGDAGGVRAALGSVGHQWLPGLNSLNDWVLGRMQDSNLDDQRGAVPPLRARDAAVFARLGELPCLLSAPTWLDLRIDPAQLLERLRGYAAAGVAAAEGDLFLALLRTDPRLGTPELETALEAVDVPVLGRDGARLAEGAGHLAARWLREPLAEPQDPRFSSIEAPAWMGALPGRTSGAWFMGHLGADVTPWWGGTAHAGSPVPALQALRSAPLSAVAARRLLSDAADERGHEAKGARIAALEAFERGLLRPEAVAQAPAGPEGQDAAALGADALAREAGVPVKALSALAAGALAFAEEGLGSVLWPLLELTLQAAVAAPRLPAGTADVAEAMASLAPQAARAVGQGIVPASFSEAPGLRALAARGGSARAPRAAAQALAALGEPAPGAEPAGSAAGAKPSAARAGDALAQKALADAAPLDTPSFHRGFDPAPLAAQLLPDGAVIEAVVHDPQEKSQQIALLVTLPGHPGVTFRVLKGWYYDLAHEGQCQAQRREEGVEPRTVYLHWDGGSAALVVTEHRNWHEGTGGPLALHGLEPPPWSVVATAAALATALHEGYKGSEGAGAIKQLVALRRFHPGNVAAAARALFASEAVVPTRLSKILEEDRASLSVLWPLVTEALAAAAQAAKPPRFTSRVLDTALARLPHLAEATRRGLIPAAAWEPVHRLAAAKGSGAVPAKARALSAALPGLGLAAAADAVAVPGGREAGPATAAPRNTDASAQETP
jgi:hypothetical protein